MKGAGPLRRAGRVVGAVGAFAFAVVAYVYVTLPDVRPLARTNPSTTAFMELRAREAGRSVRRVQRWVPYSRISRNLTRAVLVAEDAAFWSHEGVDLAEIRKSVEIAFEQGGEIRGASTITQQLAKNLYLSPSRDPLRKLRELIIARRLEAALSKTRIFEIYLNVVEWGPGIWGAEAAARTYFGVPASALSPEQAALLAGALINPNVYSPARPPARLRRRQSIILSRMGVVEPPPVPVSAPPLQVDEPPYPEDTQDAGGEGAAPTSESEAPPPDQPAPALPQPDAPELPVPQPFPAPEPPAGN